MKIRTTFIFSWLIVLIFMTWSNGLSATCSDDSNLYSNTFPYKEVCSKCINEVKYHRCGGRDNNDNKIHEKDYYLTTKGFWVDQWSFAQCNCTSYVAWKLNEAFEDAGFPSPRFYNSYLQKNTSWSDAYKWRAAAERADIEVDEYPMQVGDVAWWDRVNPNDEDDKGHVAFVEKINRDENLIEISEYNVEISCGYGVRTISIDDPDGFIHILPLHVGCSEMPNLCGPPFSSLEDYKEVPGTPDEDLPPYYCPQCDPLNPGGEGGCYDSEGNFYPDPGDDYPTTDGPDANVKYVEIDNTGNNWHHSYYAYPGQSLEVKVTVSNKGDEIIDYYEVRIYRSKDKDFDKEEDYRYGQEEETEDLAPDEKDSEDRTITAPSTPGTYYIFAYINQVDGKNGGQDQDWSNNYSRNDDLEEYAKLTVYPWPPPDWSIIKEEDNATVYIFYNNKKWGATSWEILSALGFKSEDLIIYPEGKLSEYSSGPTVLADGIFGELNSRIYLFESGKWHYLPNWSFMDCRGGQHPENVIPITQTLFDMYAGGADIPPCPHIITIITNLILGESINSVVACPNCSGTNPIVKNETFYANSDCECVGTQSLKIGPNVTIKKDSKVSFKSPRITTEQPVTIENGAEVKMGK